MISCWQFIIWVELKHLLKGLILSNLLHSPLFFSSNFSDLSFSIKDSFVGKVFCLSIGTSTLHNQLRSRRQCCCVDSQFLKFKIVADLLTFWWPIFKSMSCLIFLCLGQCFCLLLLPFEGSKFMKFCGKFRDHLKHVASLLQWEGVGTSKIRTSKDQNVESIC